jgi:hypothetical protein
MASDEGHRLNAIKSQNALQLQTKPDFEVTPKFLHYSALLNQVYGGNPLQPHCDSLHTTKSEISDITTTQLPLSLLLVL